MKTQLVESIETVEPVPEILHPKKILVPVDFSKTSKQALQYALRFAEKLGCEIVLLHVVEPESVIAGAPTAEDMIAAKAELQTLAASYRNRPKSITSKVRTGCAPNEISKVAKDLDVDLIIIATHGYTSWRHFCIGSTAERVVHTAPCPVLVVREKQHEFCLGL